MKLSIRWTLIIGFLGLIWGTHIITAESEVNKGATLFIYLPSSRKSFQEDIDFKTEVLLYGTETILVRGSAGFIQKPFKMTRLSQMVRDILDS